MSVSRYDWHVPKLLEPSVVRIDSVSTRRKSPAEKKDMNCWQQQQRAKVPFQPRPLWRLDEISFSCVNGKKGLLLPQKRNKNRLCSMTCGVDKLGKIIHTLRKFWFASTGSHPEFFFWEQWMSPQREIWWLTWMEPLDPTPKRIHRAKVKVT